MAKEVKWPTGVTQHRASEPNSDVGAKGEVTVGPGRGQTSSRPLGRQAGTVGPPRSVVRLYPHSLPVLTSPSCASLPVESLFPSREAGSALPGAPPFLLRCGVSRPRWRHKRGCGFESRRPWNVSKLPPLTEPQFASLKNGNSENPTQHKPPARGWHIVGARGMESVSRKREVA